MSFDLQWDCVNDLSRVPPCLPSRCGVYRFVAKKPFVLNLLSIAEGHAIPSSAPERFYRLDQQSLALHVGKGCIAYVGTTKPENALAARLADHWKTRSSPFRQRLCAVLALQPGHDRHLLPRVREPDDPMLPFAKAKVPFLLHSQDYLTDRMNEFFRLEFAVTAACRDDEWALLGMHRPFFNYIQPGNAPKNLRVARSAIQYVFNAYRESRFWRPARMLHERARSRISGALSMAPPRQQDEVAQDEQPAA